MENIGIVEAKKNDREKTNLDASQRQFQVLQEPQGQKWSQYSIGDRPMTLRAGNENTKSVVDEGSVCRTGLQESNKYESIYY